MMGMFDELRCSYPLPAEGANELTFQTKDTPSQFLDLYEIREDGTLWHEAYDIEWVDAPTSDGALFPFSKVISRQNIRWEFQEEFTGELRFHHWQSGMIQFSAYFVKGKLKFLELLEDRRGEVSSRRAAADAGGSPQCHRDHAEGDRPAEAGQAGDGAAVPVDGGADGHAAPEAAQGGG